MPRPLLPGEPPQLAGGVGVPRTPPNLIYAPVGVWNPPPPKVLHPKRKKRVLIGSAITVVCLALVVTLMVFIPRLDWEHSGYGYDVIERVTVPPDQDWKIQLPWVFTATETSATNQWTEIIDVYSDPELTYPVTNLMSTETIGITGPKAIFSPNRDLLFNEFALPTIITNPTIGNERLWPAGTYYIVERLGLFGSVLERPRVHVYTVDPYEGSLQIPNFTMEVTPDGIPLFEWTAVENAAMYYIVKIQPTSDIIDPSISPKIIGVVDGQTTSWIASSQDTTYQNEHQNGMTVSAYNTSFHANSSTEACEPQDAVYDGDQPPIWDDSMLSYPSYSVVAVDVRGATSFVSFKNGRDLVKTTPVATATQTLTRMIEESSNPAVFVPPVYPVTMGDCRTEFFNIAPGSLESTPNKKSAELTYTVEGTLLTHTTSTSNGGKYSEIIALGKGLGLKVVYSRGFFEDLASMTSLEVTAYGFYQTPSFTTPESPYTWNGSSEMVTYIAANLFAGKTAIDMTKFMSDPHAPLIADAVNEAFMQNPYITDMFPVVGVRDNILYVNYEMTASERAETAARLKTKVDSIIASIIEPGMSARSKAIAINEYIAKHAKYDTAAADWAEGKTRSRDDFLNNFPYAWDAEGVLIHGKGVCVSYAASFKLLADAVGLETMSITGYPNGSSVGHAWTKAKIGGKWQVIDSTWNSNIWEFYRGDYTIFFGISDTQAERIQLDSFVVDRFIPNYVAG